MNHIVKLSSMATEETGFTTTIGRIHREEEKIIEESGIPFTFLAPCIYAKFHNSLWLYNKNPRRGDAKLSFIDARDVAALSVKALTSNNQQHIGKAYTITAQEAISYIHAAGILSKEVGRRISYIDIPEEEEARKGMKENGMDHWLVDATMEFYRIIKAGHASKTTTVFERVMRRKPLSFSQLPKIMLNFSDNIW